MTTLPDRRLVIATIMAALAARPGDATPSAAADPGAVNGARAFDFFLGVWAVEHRRLRARLVGSRDWEPFAGETTCRPLMGGVANYNDSVSHRGGRVARGVGLRSFNAADETWADWYLSAADPLRIDPPGIGRFAGHVGTFLSDDSFDGRPIRVRGIFTDIRPGIAQWEQAFSTDGGRSWETNWIMRYTRIRELDA